MELPEVTEMIRLEMFTFKEVNEFKMIVMSSIALPNILGIITQIITFKTLKQALLIDFSAGDCNVGAESNSWFFCSFFKAWNTVSFEHCLKEFKYPHV